LNEIIQFFGGSVLLIAAVAWLSRSIITHLLSKDIETFKNTIKCDIEKEIALLKYSLELENEKTKIKLISLEERRINVLEELHIKLTAFSTTANNFTYDTELRSPSDLKEISDSFIEKYFEFHSYFEKVKIFLPKELEDKIKDLHNSHFNIALRIGNSKLSDFDKRVSEIIKETPSIRLKTKSISDVIAKEFRQILGVNS